MQINKETIEQLFRQHYLRMYQLARVLLKDDAASKDVVSEVFADVLDGKTQLGQPDKSLYFLMHRPHLQKLFRPHSRSIFYNITVIKVNQLKSADDGAKMGKLH